MKVILAAGAAMLATPAMAQHAPRIEYGSVPTTVVVTQSWQAPPPAPVYAPPAYPGPYYEDERRGPQLDYAPVPVDADVFAGFRIEAQVGFDRVRDPSEFLFFEDDGGKNGLSYGGEIGFDAAVGRSLIVGAYGGLEGSTVEQCDAFLGVEQCVRANRSFTAGGRIGVTLGRGALLYAKGGYTNGRVRFDSRGAGALNNFRITDDLNGFHVGGGLEASFGRNAYGKIEYVYTKLRNFEVGEFDGDDIRIDLDRHQVRAGLGLRL